MHDQFGDGAADGGDCWMPWPEKPVAKIRLSISGCRPTMPFWSKVLYS